MSCCISYALCDPCYIPCCRPCSRPKTGRVIDSGPATGTIPEDTTRSPKDKGGYGQPKRKRRKKKKKKKGGNQCTPRVICNCFPKDEPISCRCGTSKPCTPMTQMNSICAGGGCGGCGPTMQNSQRVTFDNTMAYGGGGCVTGCGQLMSYSNNIPRSVTPPGLGACRTCGMNKPAHPSMSFPAANPYGNGCGKGYCGNGNGNGTNNTYGIQRNMTQQIPSYYSDIYSIQQQQQYQNYQPDRPSCGTCGNSNENSRFAMQPPVENSNPYPNCCMNNNKRMSINNVGGDCYY